MIFQWKSFVKSSNSTIIYQAYGVPGAALDILSPFIFAVTAWDKHCYPHLTQEEAEAQRGSDLPKVTQPWLAELGFESIFPSDIELPFIIRTISLWVICYVNIHWHIGMYINLLWYLVPTWSLGSVEAWPTSRTDQRQSQRGDPGPVVRAAMGRRGRGWVNSSPQWFYRCRPYQSLSVTQSLSETCLGWPSSLSARGAEPGGFKPQLYHFPAIRPT